MTIQIQVLSVEVNNATSKAGKPYEQIVVAYKDLSNGGKVASKTLMPFGFQKEAFAKMKMAKPTDVFDIDVQKNEAGYNDWVKVTKGVMPEGGVSTSNVSAPANVRGVQSAPSKGNWETPAERAQRQVYIIRQSSLGVASTTLTASAKTGSVPTAEEVIDLAKQFEAYVLGTDKSVAAVTSNDIESLDEGDLPF